MLIKSGIAIQHSGYLRRPSSVDGRTAHLLGSGAREKVGSNHTITNQLTLALLIPRSRIWQDDSPISTLYFGRLIKLLLTCPNIPTYSASAVSHVFAQKSRTGEIITFFFPQFNAHSRYLRKPSYDPSSGPSDSSTALINLLYTRELPCGRPPHGQVLGGQERGPLVLKQKEILPRWGEAFWWPLVDLPQDSTGWQCSLCPFVRRKVLV